MSCSVTVVHRCLMWRVVGLPHCLVFFLSRSAVHWLLSSPSVLAPPIREPQTWLNAVLNADGNLSIGEAFCEGSTGIHERPGCNWVATSLDVGIKEFSSVAIAPPKPALLQACIPPGEFLYQARKVPVLPRLLQASTSVGTLYVCNWASEPA